MSACSQDVNAKLLHDLSEDVRRIARSLAKLSAEAGVADKPIEAAPTTENIVGETVEWLIKARRERARYLPHHLFSEPAWDILLDLLRAEISYQRVSVSSLAIAAGAPSTTALRYIKMMVEEGIIVRRADPHDARRIFVELAPDTSRSLRRYFAEVVEPGYGRIRETRHPGAPTQ